MRNLTHNSLFRISIFLFSLYPLIPKKIEGGLVIFFLICSLVFQLKNHKEKQFYKKEFFITAAIFIALFLGAVFSENIKMSFNKIGTMMSLLVIPLAFYVFYGKRIKSKETHQELFFKTFFISNIIFCLILIWFFTQYKNIRYPVKDANFFRIALKDVPFIGEHPIYISIFLSIAILIGFTLYKKGEKNLKNNILILFAHFILFGVLLILMSKGVIIALLLSIVTLFFRKKRVRFLLVIIICLTILLLSTIRSSNNRFSQIFDKESYINVDENNSTNIRINILMCNIELIKKKPILGYGLGDVQRELDKCYEKRNLNFPNGKYNSHNQYLYVWLSTGISGLFIFVIFIGFYYRVAISHKDYLMISIITLYCVTFLFENVLSRQTGVIFFSFLINFMTWYNISKDNIK